MEFIRKVIGNKEGRDICSCEMTNDAGMTVEIINIGCAVRKILIPNSDGNTINVVLGYPEWEKYFDNPTYFGIVAGRFANRIAGGKFSIDGAEYALPLNNGQNSLHGGTIGFGRRIWEMSEISADDKSASVTLAYTSPDGEEGYPGTMDTAVEYTLNNDNELVIKYSAVSDKKTIVNLTNHSYFNLAGKGTILNHELTLKSDAYVPINDNMIPTGEFAEVAGTPFDFRNGRKIGKSIADDNPQLKLGKGYDHSFALKNDGRMENIAVLTDPESGRTLEVDTDLPGIQLYAGNFIGDREGFAAYTDNSGLCLETQYHPDSVNQPNFQCPLLEPGKKWKSTTIFRFR